jgi:S1-C subfamily serine protease
MRRAVGLDDREGLLVRGVAEDGPAAAAGIQRGDLLVAAGETALTDVDALQGVLGALAPGAELALTLVRGVDEQTVTVTL